MAKVKVYTTNSISYLGTREEDIITGMQVNSGKLTQDDFADYLKAKQMDELVQVEAGLTGLSVRKLERREKMDFKVVKMEFEEAGAMSQDWLVNKVFDEFRGKK